MIQILWTVRCLSPCQFIYLMTMCWSWITYPFLMGGMCKNLSCSPTCVYFFPFVHWYGLMTFLCYFLTARYIPGSWSPIVVASLWSFSYILLYGTYWNYSRYGNILHCLGRVSAYLHSYGWTYLYYCFNTRRHFIPSKVDFPIFQVYVTFLLPSIKKILRVINLPR